MLKATCETLLMVSITLVVSYLIALPLAVILIETDKGGLWEQVIVNKILNCVIGVLRSIPFTILVITIIPIARFLLNTSLGTKASIFYLIFATTPYVSRIIETSLKQVDVWSVVASRVDNTPKLKIVLVIKIKQRLHDIIGSMGNTAILILGYTAMVSIVAGGGLCSMAITKGLYQYDYVFILQVILVICSIALFFQFCFKTLGNILKRSLYGQKSIDG